MEYTELQRRLMRIRDELCEGNAAKLARAIGKDATYVNRLFYPAGKPGAKGIGLEIITACNDAFKLPPGYWDGAADGLPRIHGTAAPGAIFDSLTAEERKLLNEFRVLPDEDQAEIRAGIEHRAEKARAYIQKILHQLGLPIPSPAEMSHALQIGTVPPLSLSDNAYKRTGGATESGVSALLRQDAQHRDDGKADEGSKHRRGPGGPAHG